MLEKLFGLSKKKTTVRTEVMAGLATFLTMAYITVVNPAILSTEGTGMDFGALFTATIIAAVIGTLIMGLWANWPVGLAPNGTECLFCIRCYLRYGLHLSTSTSGCVYRRYCVSWFEYDASKEVHH